MSVEPIRIVQRYKPTRVHKTVRNTYIFDMGQYISGFTELRVSGPAGTEITLAHAGRFCFETDALDTRNAGNWVLHKAAQTDCYKLKGQGKEVYCPRFTLHGFRYVEVIGYPGKPTVDGITGCAVNNDIAASGKFQCSHDLLNSIHHNVWHTFRGSFQGIPQDASDRAERFAWLGDPGYVAEDYMLNFVDARFWSKWLDDIADVQRPDGMLPFAAPPSWHECYTDWPCWENSYSLFVWFTYLYNDDEPLLERHYDGLRMQVERFRSLADNHILADSLGDHMEPRHDGTSSFSPTRTPAELTATAYYSHCAWILSQVASILGKDDDAVKYAALAEDIKAAFNAKFLNIDGKDGQAPTYYGKDSQTANALALHLNLVPNKYKQKVLNHLVKIIDDYDGHLNTGIIGTDALEQVLGVNGRADVMFRIASQTTFPGWGYGVTIGQTTIGEDFACSPCHSLSMKMLGSVEKFFYRDLAGIGLAAPGFKRINIKPCIAEGLTFARASLKTVRGLISSDWKKTKNSVTLKVTIPVNTTAEVSVPKMGLERIIITEGEGEIWKNGEFVGKAPDITSGIETVGYITLNVLSGSYQFKLGGTPEEA